MPTNYNGDPTGLAATDTVTISNPNDLEAASAASNSVGPKKLADYAKFILANAGFLAVARTWTALQSLTAGILLRSTDPVPLIDSDTVPTEDFKQVFRIKQGNSRYLRLYSGPNNDFYLTLNARWDNGTSKWVADYASAASHRLGLNTGDDWAFEYKVAAAAPWSDFSWDVAGPTVYLDLLKTNFIQAIGATLTLSGDVVATGSVSGDSVKPTAANPASTAGFTNTLTKKNVLKAWCSFVGSTVRDGFNIASVAGTATEMTVTFATAMADANYAVCVTLGDAINYIAVVPHTGKGTGSFDVKLINVSNGVEDPRVFYFDVAVYAKQ